MVAILAVGLAGCRHGHCPCRACDGSQLVYPVTCVPAPQGPAVAAQPTAPVEQPTHRESPPVARLPEPRPPAGSILMPSSAVSSSGAAPVGTLELTAEQASRLGIRPGYTPGALIIPTRQPDTLVRE
jgi:hypothetical protein